MPEKKIEKKEKPKNDDKDNELQISIPPDHAFGWLIVFAAFICSFVIDGSGYSFSSFVDPMQRKLSASFGYIMLIGSSEMGVSLLAGPLISASVNQFGFRKTAISGAFLSSISIMCSSFVDNYIAFLILFGILGGLGNGLVYCSSIIIVGHYFEKYRAIATGAAMCGSSLGILCLSPIYTHLIKSYGLDRTLQVQASLMCVCLLCSCTYKPVRRTVVQLDDFDDSKLDDYADAISETSSTIEFQNIFGKTSDVRVVDLENADRVSHRTTATLKTYKSRFQTIDFTSDHDDERGKKCCWCFRCCNKENDRKLKKKRLGPGILDRQDIFYSGSVVGLKKYKKSANAVDYHLSSLHIMEPLERHRCCSCCPEALLDTLLLMLDMSLFKSPQFIALFFGTFLFMFGLTPSYMFMEHRALQVGIPKSTSQWFVSTIALGNGIGRITCGIIAFCFKVNICRMTAIATMLAGGLSAFSAFFFIDIVYYQMFYCSALGFLLAFYSTLRTVLFVNYLGLERLTTAYGLTTLTMGFANLTTSPISAVVKEATGNYRIVFLMSGISLLCSGLLIGSAELYSKKEVKKKNRNVIA